MLGAGFSCCIAGDDPRSAEAQRNRNRTRRAKYVSKINQRRLDQTIARTGQDAFMVPFLSSQLPLQEALEPSLPDDFPLLVFPHRPTSTNRILAQIAS